MDSVLIDTSVWIEGLRERSPAVSLEIESLKLSGRLRTSTLVISELMAGEPTQDMAVALFGRFRLLPRFNESEKDWHKAALVRLGALTRRAGRRSRVPGLIDCYLAVVAMKNGALIWTLDRAFDALKSEGVRFFRP